MTGVAIDVFAPAGGEVEANGTNAITAGGDSKWHDYAGPKLVPALMGACLNSLARICRDLRLKEGGGVKMLARATAPHLRR